MSKKISGAEYPLSKIFCSEFDYVIPPYQRPYAWTEDETSELFDDLYDFFTTEEDETYFLGSIVLIKEDDKPTSQVIDGQQRLTTLTMLIATIASRLNGTLKEQYNKYIVEPGSEFEGLSPKPRLALREQDKDFFAYHVQDMNFEELLSLEPASLGNESQLNIQKNSRFLLGRLGELLNDQRQLIKFGSFLVQRCFLVAVITGNQKSAFRIFSVLNSRGLDLLPTDILKPDILGSLTEELQSEYTQRWEDVEIQTGRDGFNDLFGHIRMIYAKFKSKKSLLDEFREYVIKHIDSPEKIVTDIIEPFADAYTIVKKQAYISNDNAGQINDYIGWLNRLDNENWIPPAILFLSQHKNDSAYVLWFFEKLERLAAYLHICAKNINSRIDRYAAVLKSLENDHSITSPIEAIELTQDEKDEMKTSVDGKIYELTARRRNYLILRLDSFMADGAASYDRSQLTIEHVLPQTISTGSSWQTSWPDEEERKNWLHRIANLVPLNRRRNASAQNYGFDKKKRAYFGGKKGVSSYILTTQVLNTPKWTPSVVQKRQKDLVGILIEKWDL